MPQVGIVPILFMEERLLISGPDIDRGDTPLEFGVVAGEVHLIVHDSNAPERTRPFEGDKRLKDRARDEVELNIFHPVRFASAEHVTKLRYLLGFVEVDPVLGVRVRS
jgi:hypothetical protein